MVFFIFALKRKMMFLRHNYTATRLVFLFLSGMLLLFIVAPLLGLFFSTSLPALFETIKDTQVQGSIALTLGVSALFTLLAGLFALPLAYIMASADYTVIDQLLIPEYASINQPFAVNSIVIAYTDKSRKSDIITSENWYQILLSPDVFYGRSDPHADPCGY